MMKKIAARNRKTLFAVAFATALTLAAAPAMAQPGQAAAQQAQQPAAQEFDEADLQKFASVNTELAEIRSSFTQKLNGVQDQETAMAIQQEMNNEMVKAVQNKGLEVRTYNAIANQMSVDEELRKKVEQMGN
jgi:hypothetical protein